MTTNFLGQERQSPAFKSPEARSGLGEQFRALGQCPGLPLTAKSPLPKDRRTVGAAVNTPVGPATQHPSGARPHPHQVAKALCGAGRKPLALRDRSQEAGTTLDAALGFLSVDVDGDSAETCRPSPPQHIRVDPDVSNLGISPLSLWP